MKYSSFGKLSLENLGWYLCLVLRYSKFLYFFRAHDLCELPVSLFSFFLVFLVYLLTCPPYSLLPLPPYLLCLPKCGLIIP